MLLRWGQAVSFLRSLYRRGAPRERIGEFCGRRQIMSWRIARCKKSGRCPEWSSYATAPRKVVRIWGMLANGKLYVKVVPARGGHAHQEARPDHPEGVPEVDQGRVLEGLLGRLSSGFKSKAGCWCGSHPSDLQARPAVGVSKGAPGAQSSTGYPLDLEARPVVGAAAILRIYRQGRLLV